MDVNVVQAAAAAMLLDRGVRYKVEGDAVTIRPLRFGTLLVIARMVAEAGLTLDKIESGESQDQMRLFTDFGELTLRCVAAAELNDKEKLTDDRIEERAGFYRESLTAFQVYELFAHVLNLSGIQSFQNTIRVLLTMKERTLSPKNEQGS
jgi:hypothetical protein